MCTHKTKKTTLVKAPNIHSKLMVALCFNHEPIFADSLHQLQIVFLGPTLMSRMLSTPLWSIRQLATTGSSISRAWSTEGYSGWFTALQWCEIMLSLEYISTNINLKWPMLLFSVKVKTLKPNKKMFFVFTSFSCHGHLGEKSRCWWQVCGQ